MANLQFLFIALAFGVLAVFISQKRSNGPQNLPPGPPGHDHTKLLEGPRWNMFKAWNDQYGPVASFFIGKQRNIVLGTMKSAVDLLEKSGDINSNRPHLIMGEFLFARLRGFSMTYGAKWRNWRTLQGSMFGPQVAPNVKPMQINESAILLHDYLINTDVSKHHKILRRYTASLMFYLGYGRRVKSLQDPLCMEHDKIEEYIESTKVPGQYFIESWPVLLWLPRSLQWFRREPEKQRDNNTRLYMIVLNDVKRRVANGTAIPCTATYGLAKQEELGFSDIELAYALSAPWAAGIGTTTTALEIAILAMLHFPECVRKAQAEIDEVVGQDRMPNFEDQKALVYVDGFIKETLRWRTVTPTGIAHSSTEDKTYAGLLIPKDSTIYANAAAIMVDPEVFSDGEKFIPERFVEATDPRLVNHKFGCFGFGRRICPGMHVALQSLYIVIARMMWAFDIVPTIVNGKPFIPGADDFTTGLVSYPANLRYKLIARTEAKKGLIIAEAERANADMASLEG
ncbi:cytochrome P450 [Clathrospora elynae]|uniref:Cytochrome P450 n=1 Tax=Clathrospora elynae TaxID=706981 RepID=A0A6A5SUM6_9PLEO|nr:cytochrome P450 [Clathrospora elynae]